MVPKTIETGTFILDCILRSFLYYLLVAKAVKRLKKDCIVGPWCRHEPRAWCIGGVTVVGYKKIKGWLRFWMAVRAFPSSTWRLTSLSALFRSRLIRSQARSVAWGGRLPSTPSGVKIPCVGWGSRVRKRSEVVGKEERSLSGNRRAFGDWETKASQRSRKRMLRVGRLVLVVSTNWRLRHSPLNGGGKRRNESLRSHGRWHQNRRTHNSCAARANLDIRPSLSQQPRPGHGTVVVRFHFDSRVGISQWFTYSLNNSLLFLYMHVSCDQFLILFCVNPKRKKLCRRKKK